MIALEWWGTLDYREALTRQRAIRGEVLATGAGERVALVEHPRVVTVGRRDAGLDPAPLRAAGLDVVTTERGGLATWHGPGQLVAYVIVDVARRGGGVRRTVHALEQGVIDWLGVRGVDADRRERHPGVWLGHDKVCAVGLHFRRGVSMHGLALNLRASLTDYGRFVPCGITDGGVTSLHRHAAAPSPERAAWSLGSAVRARLVDTFRHRG